MKEMPDWNVGLLRTYNKQSLEKPSHAHKKHGEICTSTLYSINSTILELLKQVLSITKPPLPCSLYNFTSNSN